MSVFFVDTSALTKRYLTEVGSAWIDSLLDPNSGHTIVVASITRVEATAAISARQRARTITLIERDTLIRLLLHHFDTEYDIVPIDDTIISRAVLLTQNHRLRGYDAVQLATALEMNAVLGIAALPTLTVLSADNDLNAAALREGLLSENPNAHP